MGCAANPPTEWGEGAHSGTHPSSVQAAARGKPGLGDHSGGSGTATAHVVSRLCSPVAGTLSPTLSRPPPRLPGWFPSLAWHHAATYGLILSTCLLLLPGTMAVMCFQPIPNTDTHLCLLIFSKNFFYSSRVDLQ